MPKKLAPEALYSTKLQRDTKSRARLEKNPSLIIPLDVQRKIRKLGTDIEITSLTYRDPKNGEMGEISLTGDETKWFTTKFDPWL